MIERKHDGHVHADPIAYGVWGRDPRGLPHVLACVSLKGLLHRRMCNDEATSKKARDKLRAPPHGKIDVTSEVSSWRHISCHTDKNRYYT